MRGQESNRRIKVLQALTPCLEVPPYQRVFLGRGRFRQTLSAHLKPLTAFGNFELEVSAGELVNDQR
jgi:hypothetical protein